MADIPQVGEPAPDVEVLNSDGRSVALSTYWRQRPGLLAFLRHYG